MSTPKVAAAVEGQGRGASREVAAEKIDIGHLLGISPEFRSKVSGVSRSAEWSWSQSKAKEADAKRDQQVTLAQAVRPDGEAPKVGNKVAVSAAEPAETGAGVKQTMHLKTVAEDMTGGKVKSKGAGDGELLTVISDASHGAVNPVGGSGIKEFAQLAERAGGSEVGLGSLGTFGSPLANREMASLETQVLTR